MKKAFIITSIVGLAVGASVFGQEAGGFAEEDLMYPYVRVMGDFGFTYDMNGVRTVDSHWEAGHVVTDSEFDMLYAFAGPGIGVVVHAGVDLELLSLWQMKGLAGGEAFAVGGYLNTGDASQFMAGLGIGCTLLWVGKVAIEAGYSGFLSPIAVPVDYSGTYTYEDQLAGGFFLGIDLGVEVPVVIVPNLCVFACYKYFTVYIGGPVSAFDPHDQGYWLARNSVCAGLSYAIGPGMSLGLD